MPSYMSDRQDAQRLEDGRLRVPRRAEGPNGVIGEGMVLIDASDPAYQLWSDYIDRFEASRESNQAE